jgi:prepilin signal peptidase PulO-like enzyme (type II secretory pathway)
MLSLFVVAVASLFILVASLYDLKYGEIPDAVNLGFAGAIILIALSLSLLEGDALYLENALAVGIGYFAISYTLHYMGQWGGGDVKLLFGVGASLGLLNAVGYPWNAPSLPYYVVYFIDMGVVVMPYALSYFTILGLSKPEVFGKFLAGTVQKQALAALAAGFIMPLVLYMSTKFMFFLPFSAILPAFIIASIYLKTSEEVLLTKTIPTSKLKETDALAEDIIYQGKKLALRRDIEGVTKEQLKEIKGLAAEGKLPRRIKIRWGVKFAPIILAAFLLTLYAGDLMAMLIQAAVNQG